LIVMPTSQGGVRCDPTDAAGVDRRERAPGVEPVPPEPEDDAAERGESDVVAGRHPATIAPELAPEAGPEDDRAGEGDHAAHRVDDGRAGEVAEPHAVVGGLQEPARPPGPVAEDRVDETADEKAVDEVAPEVGASDHCSRGDRRAGVGKGELEQPERHERDADGTGQVVGRRGATEEEELMTDDPVAAAEHEGEAERPEEQGAQARVDDALLKDVDHFTGPGEPRLEHHEAGLHEEHEERRGEGPRRVDAAHGVRQRRAVTLGGVRDVADDPG
jgi:hypothetical protein